MATNGLEDAALQLLPTLAGAFSFVFMDERSVYAARDPLGIRPLSIGRLPNGFCFASETCALDIVGATLRARRRARGAGADRRPGASFGPVRRDAARRPLHLRVRLPGPARLAAVGDVRARGAPRDGTAARAGEHPAEADMVIAVPQTAHAAAQGYAEVSGTPYGDGLIKNNYVGRTFIQPSPIAPGPRGQAEAEPAPRLDPREAARGRRRFDRARHDHPADRAGAPRGGRDRGAPAHHVAADQVAVLLRDRHAHAPGARRART